MKIQYVVILLVVAVIATAGIMTLVIGGDDDDGSTDSEAIAANNEDAMLDDAMGTVEEQATLAPMIVTSTPDPNVIVVTVTPRTSAGGADAAAEEDAEASAETTPLVFADELDTSFIDPDTGAFIGDQAQLPEGCILHTVAEGEFPTLIIESYELPAESTFTMMAINGLTEETATQMQIGDTLVVPLEGCPIDEFLAVQPVTGSALVTNDETPEETPEITPEITAEATPEATLDVTPTPTIPPTPTLAPTVEGATVEIANIIGAGELADEGVEIVNTGQTTDISGWTLSDGDGNVYIFPDGRRLFSGASIVVNSREGTNTAIDLFWNRDEAVFAPGDIVVLTDANGDVQSSIRLP